MHRDGNCTGWIRLLCSRGIAVEKRALHPFGDVAQLGERSVRNAEVEGSNPFISTIYYRKGDPPGRLFLLTVVVEMKG